MSDINPGPGRKDINEARRDDAFPPRRPDGEADPAAGSGGLGREHDGVLGDDAELPTVDHAAADERIAGIVTQTRADLQGHSVDDIVSALNERFRNSKTDVAPETVARIAESIASDDTDSDWADSGSVDGSGTPR